MQPPADPDCVVLLHGLARGPASMAVMARALEAEGFRVINQAYPSTEDRIEALAEQAVSAAVADCGGARVHFVGHSMGGLLARHWLQSHHPANLGRMVMLGPPNQGSDLVDKLESYRIFHWINGPAGLQLGTGAGCLPQTLGPPDYEVGVIAGSLSLNPLYSYLLGTESDGKVPVDRTRVEGMEDHVVLPVSHTFMMLNPVVIAQVVAFLRHGRFEEDLRLGDAITRLAAPVMADIRRQLFGAGEAER